MRLRGSMAERGRERSVVQTNLPLFSLEEVQQHNTEKDAWVIHRGKVYDVCEFLERHPGGKDILLAYAGQDVTTLMTQDDLHKHTTFAYGWLGKYLIGRLKGDVSKAFWLQSFSLNNYCCLTQEQLATEQLNN